MKYEQIKSILATPGVIQQFYKQEILKYIHRLEQKNIQLLQENKQLDEAITICDILVKSNVEENIRLRKIIDKAIEYIEYDLKSFLYSVEYKKLLSILKGEK